MQVKKKFGYMSCPGCTAAGRATRVLVRANDRGTLSYSCDECDAPDYAHQGTTKHADWMRRLERIEAAPAEKPKEAKAAAPAPAAPAAPKAKYPWER